MIVTFIYIRNDKMVLKIILFEHIFELKLFIGIKHPYGCITYFYSKLLTRR